MQRPEIHPGALVNRGSAYRSGWRRLTRHLRAALGGAGGHQGREEFILPSDAPRDLGIVGIDDWPTADPDQGNGLYRARFVDPSTNFCGRCTSSSTKIPRAGDETVDSAISREETTGFFVVVPINVDCDPYERNQRGAMGGNEPGRTGFVDLYRCVFTVSAPSTVAAWLGL